MGAAGWASRYAATEDEAQEHQKELEQHKHKTPDAETRQRPNDQTVLEIAGRPSGYGWWGNSFDPIEVRMETRR
jgi:hypothetical protein